MIGLLLLGGIIPERTLSSHCWETAVSLNRDRLLHLQMTAAPSRRAKDKLQSDVFLFLIIVSHDHRYRATNSFTANNIPSTFEFLPMYLALPL